MKDPAATRARTVPHADPADHPQRYRHRWEMPLVALGAIISLVVLLASVASWVAGSGAGAGRPDGDSGRYALLLIGAPLFVFVARFFHIARDKANAVRVGPDQFPALWALYQDVARRIGFVEPPRLYVKNGDGVVNAYAMSCNRRAKYIVLHAEIAMLVARSRETVEFVIAHELAHHRLDHTSLRRQVVGIIPRMIPALGASTTRAQEYSADRLAHAVCDRHGGTISLLMAGPWIFHEVNHEALRRQAHTERREWFVRFANVASTHAVGVKRYDALRRLDDEGYRAHGDMF
jgi:Zn-dependent protease with chaperone function